MAHRECVPTTRFIASKGGGKRHAQDSSRVLGMIAEPTGTDGHRPIGRPWHVSPLKYFSQVAVICLSTRITLPLPHPEMILFNDNDSCRRVRFCSSCPRTSGYTW